MNTFMEKHIHIYKHELNFIFLLFGSSHIGPFYAAFSLYNEDDQLSVMFSRPSNEIISSLDGIFIKKNSKKNSITPRPLLSSKEDKKGPSPGSENGVCYMEH
jgi:hypothetical protein